MRPFWYRVIVRTALLAIVCSAGGCALYSETRDKQGQAAGQAWGKVDLKGQISVPRANLQALLTEQLAVEDEIWTTRRGQLAQSMVYGWTVKDLRDRVDQEMLRVLGFPDDAAALQAALNDIKNAQDALAVQSQIARFAGEALPSCETLADPIAAKAVDDRVAKMTNANVKGAMSAVLPIAKAKCAIVTRGLSGVKISGELQAAKDALAKAGDSLARDQAAKAAVQARFNAALAEYDAAAAALVAAPDTSREKVNAALKKLSTLAMQLSDSQNAFSVEFVSKARLASLDRFLTTYSDITAGKTAPEDASRAAIALAVFPDLVDKARVSLKDLQKPNLVPLVMQKNVEQAKLEAADREIATRNKLISLRQAHVDGLTAQVAAYKGARDALAATGVNKDFGNALLRDALKPVSEKQVNGDAEGPFESKQKMWKAVALYLDAEGRLRADVGKTRYRITAVEHEKALTYAESNINQWAALIDPSVELMATYGASGLKSSDVTAFLNSLTLLWIGAGVN